MGQKYVELVYCKRSYVEPHMRGAKYLKGVMGILTMLRKQLADYSKRNRKLKAKRQAYGESDTYMYLFKTQ